MKRKLLTILLAGVLTMSMLTACGGSKEEAAAEATEETAEETETTEATEEAEETEEAEATEDAGAAEEDTAAAEDTGSSDGSFSLLDVDESMVDVGAYGTDENGTEVVFTMFTGPDGNKYVSLFEFNNGDSSGDVICGTYEASTETDADGDEWTYFNVSDVYTGNTFQLGVCERPETQEVAFFNKSGTVIQGQFLTAADTINYMASAVNLLSQ